MTGGIVVLGSVNRDVVAEVTALPAPGETVTARRVRTNVGGKGANQAVAAHLLGMPVALVARVGDAPDSARLRGALAATGLDVAGVRAVPGHGIGTAYIAVGGGENTIIVDPGANHAWPDGLGTDADIVASATVLVMQQEVPAEINELAAAGTGARVILNAAPGRPVSATLLAHCDPLVVNVHELAALLGDGDRRPDLGVPDGIRAGMVELLGRGAHAVVTTLGPDGAAWATAGVVGDTDCFGRMPAVPVDVLDSTGAGDAFVGALAGELVAGATLPAAVHWATAAASASVRVAGTHASYPDRRTVRALLERTTGQR